MPQGSSRAIPNYVFLPGGTNPIHTQPNYVVQKASRGSSSQHRSQDDNLNRTTQKISQNNTQRSRNFVDSLLLDGCKSARNCLDSLGSLNLPQPILSGINQISNSLNKNCIKPSTTPLTSGSTTHHRYGQPNQRPTMVKGSDNLPVKRMSSTSENLLATLSRYHTIFLVDDSASMSVDGLWKKARDALSAVAAIAVKHTPGPQLSPS